MTSDELPKILCVDDEPRVLQGLESTLAWDYDCHLADGGQDGLRVMRESGPFALVISDMRMPGMNGAAFLAAAQREAPDTVRMLLTGYSDIDATIAAVNEGNIFRFLHKPCRPDVLLPAVEAAVKQYHLVISERDLLENTLGASIKVLTDVLNLAAPVAFNRSSHLKNYVSHIARHLKVQDAWQYEVAAMLSQLGCITVPPDTLERMHAGAPLSEDEKQMMNAHPNVGSDLLAKIPRLELVAEIIRRQNDPLPVVTTEPETRDDKVKLGIALIHIAMVVDRAVERGATIKGAIETLKRKSKIPDKLLHALDGYHPTCSKRVTRSVRIRDLTTFMVLADDVVTKSGSVVVGKGRTVDGALIHRLRNFASGIGLVEPFRVTVPRA